MTAQTRTQEALPRMAIWKALLLTLPVVLFASVGLMEQLTSGDVEPVGIIAGLITWILLTAFFFLMLVTGKTHRYRSILFILLAFALPFYVSSQYSGGDDDCRAVLLTAVRSDSKSDLHPPQVFEKIPFYFIPNMIEAYGTIMLTDEMTYSGEAAFCPLTMPMVLLPAALKGVVIFPGSIVAGGTWFLLWLGTSLSVGRGWCSWGCFFGGWDEFFSRLRKKPTIKRVDRQWRFLPFAILLAIVLLSALTFHPIYCEYLCPFKAVTEFEAPTSLRTMVTLGIFVSLFIGLVIALPLLTKKRIQCALFCPFGAMQSFFNKINIFEVRIDPAKCTQCKRCFRECPTFSLDDSSLESGKALMSCTKCGQCVDACPQGAMSYHIKGTPVGVSLNMTRLLFLYPAYILFCVLGGHIVTMGLWRVLKLITTGSMI